ncbi:glycosyltransferase family 2 protein [Paenibacillus gorillae]|uniref:glycosyltransferase family 2 protein n=1 Tax=Paenibacillus gorillae TaxID=1243662 RepID=UPI0004B47D31|nr:glycosyltransferase family 2 protein [Paenibacillus gorillae]
MATVSICIVTYNSAEDIEACLDAVWSQVHPIDRIVIVDNASSDGTATRIERYDGSERIFLVKNTINNGFAGGQNQAISHTDSDYVLVLNPDVTLDSGYVSYLVAFMEENLQAGSATGRLVLSADLSVMDSAGLGMRRTRQAYDLGAGEPVSKWAQQQQVFGVSGAAAFYRMDMVRDLQVDGQFFDEEFFAYKEDVDVAWRARQLGWLSHYIPEAKAVHHRGWKKGGRTAIPLFVRRHSYQNRFFTLLKNEQPGWHLLKLIPLLIAVEIVKLGYIILKEPGLLRCWPVIFRSMPDMLRKRKLIQIKVKQGQMQLKPSNER